VAERVEVTPDIREAVLHALAMVNASRSGFDGNIPFEGARRELVPMALAGIAVALLDELRAAGGDPDRALRDIYRAVTAAPGSRED